MNLKRKEKDDIVFVKKLTLGGHLSELKYIYIYIDNVP